MYAYHIRETEADVIFIMSPNFEDFGLVIAELCPLFDPFSTLLTYGTLWTKYLENRLS